MGEVVQLFTGTSRRIFQEIAEFQVLSKLRK
jgi:hypothetical protein